MSKSTVWKLGKVATPLPHHACARQPCFINYHFLPVIFLCKISYQNNGQAFLNVGGCLGQTIATYSQLAKYMTQRGGSLPPRQLNFPPKPQFEVTTLTCIILHIMSAPPPPSAHQLHPQARWNSACYYIIYSTGSRLPIIYVRAVTHLITSFASQPVQTVIIAQGQGCQLYITHLIRVSRPTKSIAKWLAMWPALKKFKLYIHITTLL